MWRSWRLGKLFGIPIYLHPSFFIVPLLAFFQSPEKGWSSLIVVALILTVFFCVLLHELGHALMARYFGIGTRDITLTPIGGIARLSNMGDSPKQELLIALAGPAVNVVIATMLTPLIFLLFMKGLYSGHEYVDEETLMELGAEFLAGVWLSNIILVLFNLLPAFPMDGGRVLRALLNLGVSRLRATEIAARVGVVVAFLIAAGSVYTGNFMLIFVALFVVFAGQAELQSLRYREVLQQPIAFRSILRDEEEQSTGGEPRFSGYTWDYQSQAWVQWVDGQPMSSVTTDPIP